MHPGDPRGGPQTLRAPQPTPWAERTMASAVVVVQIGEHVNSCLAHTKCSGRFSDDCYPRWAGTAALTVPTPESGCSAASVPAVDGSVISSSHVHRMCCTTCLSPGPPADVITAPLRLPSAEQGMARPAPRRQSERKVAPLLPHQSSNGWWICKANTLLNKGTGAGNALF